ncbi:MAG: hypothetical protein K940chlam2_01719, partial [Chlamydiae bacterium]|nr:hypothetical protein [Chlamydiota bacterium]
EIIYYALAEISDSTDANSLWVRFIEAPIYTLDGFEGTSTRTVPWNWGE